MKQIKIQYRITKRTPNLDKYLKEIFKHPLLTPEEEVELSIKIKKGDENALKKLVTSNLRFVVSVAKQYYVDLELIDLINTGNLGLIKAARRFDHSRGFKFTSYAIWWIRQAILEFINEYSKIIKIPDGKKNTQKKIEKYALVFLEKNEREPTKEDLLALNIYTEEDIILYFTNQKHLSLNYSLENEDSESSSLLDILNDNSIDPPDKNLNGESLKRDLSECLLDLTQLERNVIESYFGLSEESRLGMNEIAKKFNLSKGMIRQIKEIALRKLRKKNLFLKEYLS